jgi:ParB family chromosome partitioning protein
MGTTDAIVEVSPFVCRMWELHDRIEEYIGDSTGKAEVESFDRYGQLIPVLGRPVRGEPGFEVELIYGARRLHIARQLNKPIRVMLRDVSDREAVVAMDAENRHRKDISPYERGSSYARLLRSGFFGSQEELAQALNTSASQVSRLLKLTRLPALILGAFSSPLEICEVWGLTLLSMWEDPMVRPALSETARALAARSPKPPAQQIYDQLLTARAHRPRPLRRRKEKEEIITDPDGTPLFRVRRQVDSMVLVLPTRGLSGARVSAIKQMIGQLLQKSVVESRESPVTQLKRAEPEGPRKFNGVAALTG